MNMVLIGTSAYITGTQYLQPIKDSMESHGMNVIRISFRESFLGAGSSRTFQRDYVDWFLANTTYTIIIEPNHIYPPDENGAQTFREQIDNVDAHLVDIATMYANNPRIMIEPMNEYVSNDFWDQCQHFIDLLRPITNCPLVFNKWNQSWTVLNDPLDRTYYGYHFYFNSWSVSGAMGSMQDAITAGIPANRIINTEIGADWNEESSLSASEVQEVNDFLQQCADLGIGNTIWNYQNIQNMDTYELLGLIIPDTGGNEPMANVTFSGTVNDQETNAPIEQAIGNIDVTTPSGVVSIGPLNTDANGNFNTSVQYTEVGDYSATATFTKDGYNDTTSNTVSFTITPEVRNMVVILNVLVE
jgi:hypothetical protein